MKKYILLIIVLILLGGLIFWVVQFVSQEEDDLTILKNAYLQNGSAVCTFSDNGLEFITHIKEGDIRINSGDPDSEMKEKFIIKNGTIYFWTENFGEKVSFTEEEIKVIPLFSSLEDEEKFADLVEKHQISCEKTSVKDDLFEIPEDVEFKDYTN